MEETWPKWKFIATDPSLAKNEAVQAWLRDLTARVRAEMERTNYDQVLADWALYGTLPIKLPTTKKVGE